jgi:hypothetical protein
VAAKVIPNAGRIVAFHQILNAFLSDLFIAKMQMLNELSSGYLHSFGGDNYMALAKAMIS